MGRDDLREAPGLEVVLCMEGHVPLYDRQLLRRGALDWGEACRAVAATARSLGPCHYAHNMARLIHAGACRVASLWAYGCDQDPAACDWVTTMLHVLQHPDCVAHLVAYQLTAGLMQSRHASGPSIHRALHAGWFPHACSTQMLGLHAQPLRFKAPWLRAADAALGELVRDVTAPGTAGRAGGLVHLVCV